MRLLRSIDQLKGSRILVMGLGTKDGGVGATLFAASKGADVTVTDMQNADALEKPLRELRGLSVELKLGRHDRDDFLTSDIIIRNPGIKRDNPFLKAAREAGGIIESPIGLFCEIVESKYIGITGTKGKSFTTHFVQHILANTGMKAVAAGNNCVSPLRFLDDPETVFVLELSSWQLREMGLHEKSPHIACWLNFFPDHLDFYSDLDEYRDDKQCITQYQNSNDCLILPWDDPELRNVQTNAGKMYFSANEGHGDSIQNGCCIVGNRIVIKKDGEVFDVAKIDELPHSCGTPHHRELVMAGICCAYAYGVPPDRIGPAVNGFDGLSHRFERITEWRGITFINDSAATTPESVSLAVDAVDGKPLVLVFGGGGVKSLSYEKLAEKLARKCDRIILFQNDKASSEMHACLPESKRADIIFVDSMMEAVKTGTDILARIGDGTLLLSPGCSGAPYYTDLFVRGELFRECVGEVSRDA